MIGRNRGADTQSATSCIALATLLRFIIDLLASSSTAPLGIFCASIYYALVSGLWPAQGLSEVQETPALTNEIALAIYCRWTVAFKPRIIKRGY
jgi:hypothetical protein